jgi:hypothetical protein
MIVQVLNAPLALLLQVAIMVQLEVKVDQVLHFRSLQQQQQELKIQDRRLYAFTFRICLQMWVSFILPAKLKHQIF